MLDSFTMLGCKLCKTTIENDIYWFGQNEQLEQRHF
jgi:hypothetical protein